MSRPWNPYASEEILELVFKFCSYDTLYAVRMVSKRWESRSKKYWRRVATLRLTPEEDSIEWLSTDTFSKMYNEENDAYQLRQYPYERYDLDSSLITSVAPIMDHIWPSVRFLNVFEVRILDVVNHVLPKATRLRHLQLATPDASLDLIQNNREGEAERDELNRIQCASLKRLDIIEPPSWHATAWRPILHAAINLDTIWLEAPYPMLQFCVTDILNDIKALRRQNPQCLNIKSFRVNGDGISQFSALLEKCRLCLRSLSLSKDGFVFPVVVSTILRQQRQIVELEDFQHHVSWILDSSQHEWDFGEPKYKSVRWWEQKELLPQLKIHYGKAGIFNAMYFLRTISAPNLEKILIDMQTLFMENEERQQAYFFERVMTSHDCFKQLMSGLAFSTVTTFEYQNQYNIFTSSALELLTLSMPGVVHLKMPLSASTIGIVYKNWPNLQSLTVHDTCVKGNGWTDEAIIGSKDEDIGNGESSDASPSIRLLKDLRRFTMLDVYASGGRFTFTQKVVTNGFLLLPVLHHLEFPLSKLSSSCYTKLKKHVRVLKLPYNTRVD